MLFISEREDRTIIKISAFTIQHKPDILPTLENSSANWNIVK